jgi:hypothetical protein
VPGAAEDDVDEHREDGHVEAVHGWHTGQQGIRHAWKEGKTGSKRNQ